MASVARITDIRGLVSLNDGEEILKEKDPISENGGILTISDFARIIFDDGREIEVQGPVQITLNENFFQTGEFDIQDVQIENLNLVRDTVENLVTNIEGGTLPENPSEAFVATEQLDTLLENDEVISSTRSVEDDFAPTEAPEAPTEAPEAPTEAPEAPIPDTPTTDEPETTVDVTFPDTDEQTTDEVAEDTIPEETVDIPESTVDAVEEDTIAAIPEQTTPETVVVEAVDEQTTPAVDESTVDASENTVDESVVTEYKPEETTSVSVPPSVVVTTTLLTTVATAGEFTTVFEAESSEGEDVFSLKFDENGTTLVATNHLTNEEVSYDMTNELQNGQSHEIGMNISEFGMSIVVNGSDVASLEFNQVIDMPTSLTVTEAPNLEQEGIYISGLDADIIPAVMNSSEDAFASFEDIVLDLELASIKEPESLSSDLLSSNSELNLSDMVGDESDNIDLSNIVSSQPKEESSSETPKNEPQGESPFDVINNNQQHQELASSLIVPIEPDTI